MRLELLFLALLLTLAFCAAARADSAKEYKAYLDPKKPVEIRVKDLLSRMTVEEKVHELTEDWGIPGNERIGIPFLSKAEAVHGFGYGEGATIFPQAIGLAATWNTDLVYRVADVIGEETLEANTYQAWSPVLDVARDPRWGRVEESYGEDPYLVSRMGVAYITGFQKRNLIATPKHFAAHGAPLGGRDSNDVGFSERVMREVFLPPFRAAFVEAKAGSVMNAYSAWEDGAPCVSSKKLLMGILREEWGFEGFVVSDCGSVEHLYQKHGVAADGLESAKWAIEAGVSCNCGDAYKNHLLDAIKAGMVSQQDLDFAAGRILRSLFLLGLFENPPKPKKWDNNAGWDSPEHRAVALQAARESIVMLKNEKGFLPLKKSMKSIAVIGPSADDPQLGDYSCKPKEGQLVSVLDGVKKIVSPSTVVRYARGCDHVDTSTKGFAEAVKIAKDSDVAIVVVGDKSDLTSGENHDRAHLNLPGVQDELVKAVGETGTPTILVLSNGRPVIFNWAADKLPAILATWYPGEEGGTAAAEVIFGDYNPAGRLPITFPRFEGQLPLYYNYKPSGRNYDYFDEQFAPRYAFGHGLSYTKFEYSNLQITPRDSADGNVNVSVDVRNTGARAGDEVVELYITDMVSSVSTPVMELKGFRRITLQAGETKTVEFALTPYQLSLLDRNMDRAVEPGSFKVMVGGVSPSAPPHDGQKVNVGYSGPDKGVSAEFEVTKRLAAAFKYSVQAPAQVKAKQTVTVKVSVRNSGQLTDVGQVKLFVDGKPVGSKRFELDPGKSKTFEFPVVFAKSGSATVTAVGKDAAVSKTATAKAAGR
ncbi:MAG: glycoside hydrolase family 3 N-terminal domain-containing protein [Armatimonadota bacterium]|nr:glycoside hydrolase family 3 N-terminal domain-containing protein [Armatimonadota bacterium]